MRDLVCDVISYCATSFAIGKIKHTWTNGNYQPGKEIICISKKFYVNFHLTYVRDDLRMNS